MHKSFTFLTRFVLLGTALLTSTLLPGATSFATSGPWEQLQGVSDSNPGIMFLLTDGTVLVQDQGANSAGSGEWWILTPDSKGNYVNGKWSRTDSMPNGYKPPYASSGVLPDGRVIVVGGELNGSATWVGENLGAIDNPILKTWSAVNPPNRGRGKFASMGDGPSIILANGQFMLGPAGRGNTGELGQTKQAILNPSNLSWSVTGRGISGANPESRFTLLQNDKILTIDTPVSAGKKAEIFDPASGVWSSAGVTPVSLLDPSTAEDKNVAEIGPAITMPNGLVFAEGSNQHTAIYNFKSNSWVTGPDFPSSDGQQMHTNDAGSEILQNGNVLFDASPVKKGKFTSPVSFYTFDGRTIHLVDPPRGSISDSIKFFIFSRTTERSSVGE